MHPSLRILSIPLLLLAGCTPQRPPASAPAAVQRYASDPGALAAALDEKVPGWIARHGVPSLAVAYIRDGAVQWVRVYGEQAPGIPATPRTLYNVASLAKPVSAETFLRLAADGRVSLDEPLAGSWVDPDVANDPRHRLLTSRLALSHQSGFRNWRYQTGGVLRFEFEPGTGFGYSGEGYEYVKRFAERKLGESWEALSARYLFEPLGMRSTSYTRKDWFEGRVALPYGAEGRYGEPSYQPTASAADDLYTTVGDYAAFLVGVMNRDGLPGRYALQRDSIHGLNAEAAAGCDPGRVARCPRRIGMGLGWEIMELPGETVRVHTGGDWGESTMALYIAERREGAVMLTNGANGIQPMIDVIDLLFRGTAVAEFALSRR